MEMFPSQLSYELVETDHPEILAIDEQLEAVEAVA